MIEAVPRYDAVLFDWSCTLAHEPGLEARLRWALARLGRPSAKEATEAAARRLAHAWALPELLALWPEEDCSLELHRAANLLWFERAGCDDELADALYDFDYEPANRPLYPDAADVLGALRRRGVRLGLVSDIHFDLRPSLAGQGVGGLFETYVLSYVLGYAKPDRRMFETALRGLGVAPERALMVGDRHSHDGASEAAGVAALILPPTPATLAPRGLDAVLRAVG